MSAAVVITAAGGAFRIADAYLVTLDHVFGRLAGKPFHYEVQDGDSITFVQDAKAIRHTFPDGTTELVTGGTKATPVRFTETDATTAAVRLHANHPGHRFDLVPFPGE